MRMNCRHVAGALLLSACWVVAGYGQQTKSEPKPGETVKIQGQVTEVQMPPGDGLGTLKVKTPEGKEYTVYVGRTADLRRQGFRPFLQLVYSISAMAKPPAGIL